MLMDLILLFWSLVASFAIMIVTAGLLVGTAGYLLGGLWVACRWALRCWSGWRAI